MSSTAPARKAQINRPAASPARSGAEPGMQLRKFVGSTMAEALSRVKGELGPSAVILSTRTVQHRRLLGLIRREQIEITAGRGIRTVPQRRQAARATQAGALTPQARSLLQAAREARIQRPHQGPTRELLNTPAAASAAYLGVTQEIGDLKQMVGDLVTRFRHSQAPDVPAPLFDLYRRLRDQQVSEEAARGIVSAAHAEATAHEATDAVALAKLARRHVEAGFPTAGPLRRTAKGRPHIVALIGPTGVGKTTTIAKLAANLSLRDQKRVGLITIDTYRIAAIDQLRKYAQIINAPLAVVSSPAEIKDAVARMGDLDFILIDTAGRSPRDAVKLKELKQFLGVTGPDEVHLVLSATCGEQSTRLALDRFAGVRADRLIFTKLDEAGETGVLLNTCTATRLPVSYVTTGQDVPNDIEVATSARLAQWLLQPE